MDRARLLCAACRQMRGLSRGDLRTLDGFSCVPEDGFGIFQKRFSCRCEADTAVRPLEERGTDAFFQRIHLLHHGRGGKGKLFRRFVETAVLVTEMNVCSVSLIILHILQVKTMY